MLVCGHLEFFLLTAKRDTRFIGTLRRRVIYRPFGYERVYLPLCRVAVGNDILHLISDHYFKKKKYLMFVGSHLGFSLLTAKCDTEFIGTLRRVIYRPLGYESVFLPLCRVADTRLSYPRGRHVY